MIIIQFSKNRGIGSRLIRWFTWSHYSHVDIVMPDGRLLGAMTDGVKIRNNVHTDYIRYQVQAPSEVIMHALKQIDKPYDWSALFGFVFRKRWQDDSRWFCSELVAWSFSQSGRPLLKTDAWRVTPGLLMTSPHLSKMSD